MEWKLGLHTGLVSIGLGLRKLGMTFLGGLHKGHYGALQSIGVDFGTPCLREGLRIGGLRDFVLGFGVLGAGSRKFIFKLLKVQRLEVKV